MVVKAGLIPIVAFINWRWQICGYFEWLVVLEGGISGKIIFRMMILEVSWVLTTLGCDRVDKGAVLLIKTVSRDDELHMMVKEHFKVESMGILPNLTPLV